MKRSIFLQLFAFAFVIILSSCSKNDDTPNPVAPPKNFVLVHGAWQAPYVWDAVKSNLEKNGDHVTVVELPGHGSDQTPPETITLDLYKNKVIEAISHIDGKVILVGHSLSGIVISSVAEQIPAKIEKLVYVAAYLPASGQSLQILSKMDPTSLLGANLEFGNMPTANVKQDQITNIFIQDGTQAAKDLVLKNYRPEPVAPLGTPVTLTAANFGAVEKAYINTAQDRAVTPTLQGQMITAGNVKTVFSLNTSHSPFLSKPDSLSILLVKIAQ
jgi:pimeloyl-ACP methyl ester carboxylesterase